MESVGGILTETKLHNEEVRYIVLEIGINIQNKTSEEIKRNSNIDRMRIYL